MSEEPAVVLECPECGADIEIDAAFVSKVSGRRIQCMACDSTVPVPDLTDGKPALSFVKEPSSSGPQHDIATEAAATNIMARIEKNAPRKKRMPKIVSSLLSLLFVLAVCAGCWIGLRIYMVERFHKKVLRDAAAARDPGTKIKILKTYTEKYPVDVRTPELQDQIDALELKRRGLDARFELAAVTHGGDEIPLTGTVQLLRSDKPYAAIMEALDGEPEIVELRRRGKEGEQVELKLFDAIGVYLKTLKPELVAEAPLEEGVVKFAHLRVGEYLLYGGTEVGENTMGYFGAVKVTEDTAEAVAFEHYLGGGLGELHTP